MRHDFLNIGEVKAFDEPAELACYGLGSCVGVFVYDFLNKVGGGAHIALPKPKMEDNKSSMEFAENALEELISKVDSLGKRGPKSLRAKVIGGANVLSSNSFDIGKENAETVKQILLTKKVFIAGFDVGGGGFRSGKFQTHTGKLTVSTEHENYDL